MAVTFLSSMCLEIPPTRAQYTVFPGKEVTLTVYSFPDLPFCLPVDEHMSPLLLVWDSLTCMIFQR